MLYHCCPSSVQYLVMPQKSSLFFLLPVLLFIVTACGPAKDTRPGQPVAHRQKAFGAILRSFEPMGIQLRKGPFEPESFLKYAQELAAQKNTPWPYFGADTFYPPTRTTEAAWQEPERFAAEQETFSNAVDQLLTAAQTQEQDKIRPAYQAVEESCRSCHKLFRK
jgi:cytochrome c556